MFIYHLKNFTYFCKYRSVYFKQSITGNLHFVLRYLFTEIGNLQKIVLNLDTFVRNTRCEETIYNCNKALNKLITKKLSETD